MFIAALTIWAMAFLLALDNLGVQIKPLLAGLGIGGIAVALAVQTVLGDLLASMSIALDKPFVVGDALQVDDLNGTVEHIGVKSTRLRSLTGEQIIISNARHPESARAEQRPHARPPRGVLRQRELRHALGEAAADSGLVQDIVMKQPKPRFDRCHLLQMGGLGAALRSGVLHDDAGLRRLRRRAAGHQSSRFWRALQAAGTWTFAFPYAPPPKPAAAHDPQLDERGS